MTEKNIIEINRENKLSEIEQRILSGSSSGTTWMGIEIRWMPLALKNGGTLKRKGSYGKIAYCYLDKSLSRDEALAEVSKPSYLRQALIEAQTFIECSMCGKVVAGKDALDPYQSVSYATGERVEKKPWGLVFYRMNPDRINEPICLNFCPECLKSIANGDYRNTSNEE